MGAKSKYKKKKRTRKKVLSLDGLQSAVCSPRGLRFKVTIFDSPTVEPQKLLFCPLLKCCNPVISLYSYEVSS